jgi:hypothetical protein
LLRDHDPPWPPPDEYPREEQSLPAGGDDGVAIPGGGGLQPAPGIMA